MRLFEFLLRKHERENEVNFCKTYLQKTIDETLCKSNMNGCRMTLFSEKDHYMLEIASYIRSTIVRSDGNQEINYNKLLAYVRIGDNGARFLGSMLDAPLYTEKSKQLMKIWKESVKDFTVILNDKLKNSEMKLSEQMNRTVE